MTRHSFASLRLRLIILVLTATIPALGITIYSGIERRNQARLHAFDGALRLAQEISEDHDHLIQNARQILFTLSKISQVHKQDKTACSKIFDDIMKQSEGYTALVAAKPNGDVFASNIPITRPVNFADRPWFQRLLKTRDFVIGEYLIGRVSGKPLIVLAYPVLDDIGNLKAVLVFGMDLDWLNQTIVKGKLQEGTSVSVIDSDSTILFRHPEPEKVVGKSMPEVPIVKAIFAKREGVEETVGLDGVPRLFGFTSLGKGVESVHVSVGIPRQIALAKAYRAMKHNLVYLGLIALLALAAAWFMGGFFIIHPVNRLLDTTNQLANGDLTVRTGPSYGQGEIGQLAWAFDHMATSLEQREAERSRAENEVISAKARLEYLLSSSPAVIYACEPRGDYPPTFISANIKMQLGYDPEEFLSDPKFWIDRIHPEDAPRIFAELPRLFEQGHHAHEYRFLHKNGTYRWIHDEMSPMKDEEGNPLEIVGSMIDITERKRAEENLRESEEKYRTILENIEEGYYEVDIAGNLTFFNNSICRILGYSRNELMGMNNRQYTDQENAKKLYQTFDEVYRTRKPIKGVDWEIIRKDGTKRFGEVSVSLIEDSKGEPIGFRGIARDITERKRAEESLRRSEEESKNLAKENAIMAEIGRIINSTLNIEEVYERFAEEVRKCISFDRIAINIINHKEKTVIIPYVFGVDVMDRRPSDVYPLAGSFTEEVMRARSGLLIQTEDVDEVKIRFPGLLTALKAGLRSTISVPLISKDQVIGSLYIRSLKPNAYTESNLILAEKVGNQIAGAIANAQLFAEHMRAEEAKTALEEQLRQSQKMEAIGQLAGGIAHDFNNLLTVIKGYSQISLAEIDEKDPLRPNIEEIKRAADRAADLTHQLLAFSRRQIMEMKVLDINTVVKNLDKMLRRVIGEDIEMLTLLAEDLGRVKTDPGWIEQVILNISVNARDAMPEGGKLTIETANVELDEDYAHKHIAVKPGRYVMVSVSDNGVGMAPEVRERVFEPFFTTKERGKGTGLGLSTVYGIAKQSGGNIWVYSEPGKGTTLKVYLPRVDEPLEEDWEKIAGEELPRGSETILVVEDVEEVRKLAVRILRQQGYKVLEASQGLDGFLICGEYKGPIHLLLTDVVMPKVSGRELADRIVSIRPEIKVLYMSGYMDNAIVHHGVLREGVSFVQKPFTVDGLARKVREVLDKDPKLFV